MNPYSIPSLICLLTMPILGVYIFSRNSKSEIHRFFLVLIAGISFWAFTEFNVRQSESYTTALFWIRTRTFRILLGPILIHFILIYINKWKEYSKPLAYFLTYSMSLLLVFSDLIFGALTGIPTEQSWGWTVGKPLWPVVIIFYSVWNIIALIFVIKESAVFIKSANPEEHKSFFLLLWGLIICMIIGTVSGTIYTMLRPEFPELTIIVAFFFALYLSFIIWKYNLLISSSDTAENIIELMGDGLILSGIRNRILRVNSALLQLTGYNEQELIGTDISLLITDTPDGCSDEEKQRPHDAQIISKTGLTIPVLLCQTAVLNNDNTPAETVTIVKDLTLWHKAQKELVHAEKLESFELIIRGITHDFNNLLTVICCNLSLTEHSDKLDKTLKNHVETAGKAALVAVNLTNRLATYAKEDMLNTTMCNLTEIIEEAAELTLKGSSITYNDRSDKNLWTVHVDRYQMIQVFVNLFINARQAMTNAGSITVQCVNKMHEEQKESVEISIHDNGPGIPSTLISRVFDPFFTTKVNGSGLGLSIVKNIIIAHHGRILVKSKQGGGTTFTILLPKAATTAETILPMVEPAEYISSKKILIMDDDESVRLALSSLLSKLGHITTTTKDGSEAIEVYTHAHQNGSPFECIILDLTVVSGIGGEQVIKKIIEIEPSAKVILTSGYESHPVIDNFEMYGFHSVLKKPFSLKDIQSIIADAFNACTVN